MFHRRPRSNARPRGRGQALVEFSLVIPIFLVLMVGVFDLGRAVFAYNTLTNAAREGARLAIVNQHQPSIIERAKKQTAIVELEVPNVTVGFYQVGLDGTPDTTRPCTNPIAVGCLVAVSFEATYRPITPLIGNIVFGNGVTFTAKSILTVEYTCPMDPTNYAASLSCNKQP